MYDFISSKEHKLIFSLRTMEANGKEKCKQD